MRTQLEIEAYFTFNSSKTSSRRRNLFRKIISRNIPFQIDILLDVVLQVGKKQICVRHVCHQNVIRDVKATIKAKIFFGPRETVSFLVSFYLV
jgi:hypothetical protein